MIELFVIGLVILVLGYKFYSPYVLRQMQLDEGMEMPAHKLNDGVDYTPISTRKSMLIQLLNIAGTGPIFGPILAALFGPIVLIFIPIGNIFAGAVMDLGFGVLSVKNEGKSLPVLARKYMGNWSVHIITFFTAALLLLVATVFVVTPSNLLVQTFGIQDYFWWVISAVFAYFVLATVTPIQTIVARFYPIMGVSLLLGTAMLLIGTFWLIFSGAVSVPTIMTAGIFSASWHPNYGNPGFVPLLPGFIVAMACGVISGFHTTQSPIVAKTLDSGKDVRKTFYGMMALEGAVAMVWAFAALALFSSVDLQAAIVAGTPSYVVGLAAEMTLGPLAIFLIFIVILFPITSGDTAFRALRSVFAELLNIDQKAIRSRLLIAIPLFAASIALVFIGFGPLWAWFVWSNHMLSVMSLLLITGYLKSIGTNYWVTLIPLFSLFLLNMLYIFTDASIGAGLSYGIGLIAAIITVAVFGGFSLKYSNSWRGSIIDEK